LCTFISASDLRLQRGLSRWDDTLSVTASVVSHSINRAIGLNNATTRRLLGVARGSPQRGAAVQRNCSAIAARFQHMQLHPGWVWDDEYYTLIFAIAARLQRDYNTIAIPPRMCPPSQNLHLATATK